QDLALDVDGDLLAQVAHGHRGRDLGDVAHLPGKIRGHHVHRVGKVLPRAADAAHVGLPAELPFAADLARHARDLGGEGAQLVDHRVDLVLQLQDLAADVDGDLLRQIAHGHRGRDLGDVAHLSGEVRGHEVDVVGEVLPRTGHAGDDGLPAELPFRADFARHARDLGGERAELIDHRVDRVLQLQDLAAHFDGDLLREVAHGHGGRDLGDVAH